MYLKVEISIDQQKHVRPIAVKPVAAAAKNAVADNESK